MTKAAPSVSRSPRSVRSSPVLAVDRPHQREIEQHGDAGSRQHADGGRQEGRDAVLHDEHDDDRGEHHDLAVREVEDAAEAVDQRHPDAEQAERQPEHDPVEDDRFHGDRAMVGPRLMRHPGTRVGPRGSGRARPTSR